MMIRSPNHPILREIGALSRCVHAISDAKFKKLQLQKGQFIFLTRICEHPGLNQIDLSNLLKVDKTTTAKAVQKLIEHGYIHKVKDSVDQRMWRLHPLEKGLATYRLVIAEENRNIAICFAGLSAADQQTVGRLIRMMRENLETDWSELKQTTKEELV